MPGVMFEFDPDMTGVIVLKNYFGVISPQLVTVVVCDLNFFIRRENSRCMSAEDLIALVLKVWTLFWGESMFCRTYCGETWRWWRRKQRKCSKPDTAWS